MSENLPHTANSSSRFQKKENMHEESTIPKLCAAFAWEVKAEGKEQEALKWKRKETQADRESAQHPVP